MKLETTAEEQYVAELIKDRGHYPKLARRMFDERNTLLARNEELERAVLRLGNCVDLYLQGAVDQVALRQRLIAFQRALINGEETTIEQPTVEDEGRSCCSENPGANVGCCPDRVARQGPST